MIDIVLQNVIWVILLLLAILLPVIIAIVMYTIVPADQAHVVIKRGRRLVYSSDPKYRRDAEKASYFAVPKWVPGFGMIVHEMPLNILSVAVPDFLSFDMNRARFTCEIRAFVMIEDPIASAMRFPSAAGGIDIAELGSQMGKIVQATMRDATTKKNIRDIINNRQGIIDYIKTPLAEVLRQWGLILTDIELIDFKDPLKAEFGEKEPSHVIRDISFMEEVKINAEMRRKNAEELKLARLTEAETNEAATKREIEQNEEIAKREQLKNKLIAEKQKEALEKELEVKRTQATMTQAIEKQRAIIEAEQKKEVEEIHKKEKQLIGEGDKVMKTEQAKGDASPIRERGFAEAEAKEKLQLALNKFGDKAIRALVAEKIIDMQKEVGIAGANALSKAQVKLFSGGGPGAAGFEMGKLIEGMRTSSESTALSTLNNIARPNDLGFKSILGAMLGVDEEIKKEAISKDPAEAGSEPIPEKKWLGDELDDATPAEEEQQRRKKVLRRK